MKQIIKTVPNQRVIIVNKALSDKNHLYSILNLEALDKACNLLQSKAGIKLYLYFAKNQDKYKSALSSADFIEWSGVSIKAYNTAFQELIDKGYLKKHKDTINTYDFYENGIKHDLDKPKAQIEISNNESTGFVF